jgi:hypothetical protein
MACEATVAVAAPTLRLDLHGCSGLNDSVLWKGRVLAGALPFRTFAFAGLRSTRLDNSITRG